MQDVREVSRIDDAENNGKPAIGEKGVWDEKNDKMTGYYVLQTARCS